MEDIDKRIDEYSGLFDLYIEGKPIPPEYKDDPVAGYIEEICQDSGNKELCRKEETWKEIFRKEIISMLEGILPVVSTIEREYEEEMKILSHFFASNIEQKRLAWNGIAKHLHDTFDSSMFNIHGYIVSVSVFTYCHKKLIKRGGLPSFVSLLWKVANGLAIGFYNSPMVHWVAIGQSCQGCR